MGGVVEKINAQQIRVRSGSYALKSGTIGESQYQFFLSGKDTILQGPFLFRSTSLDAEGDNLFLSLQYQGNFKSGFKDGAWIYSFKVLQPLKDFFEDDNKITFMSRGTERLVKAEFADGKASGCWEWSEQDIDQSSTTGASSRMQASFEQGVLNGEIVGEIHHHHIVGKADNGALADGKWIIKFPEKDNRSWVEVRIFRHGQLIEHFLSSGADTIHYRYGGLEIRDEWVEVPLHIYLKVLSKALLTDDSDALVGNMKLNAEDYFQQSNLLLAQAFSGFLSHRDERIWGQISGAEEPSMLKFKVPKLPAPSGREQANSIHLKKLIADTQEDLSELLNDSEIEINRYINPKVTLYSEALRAHEKVLNSYSQLIVSLSDPSFEFIRKSEFYSFMLASIQYPERLKFEVEGIKYEEPFAFPRLASTDYDELHHLKAFVVEIENAVKGLEDSLDNALEVKQKEKRLQEKEQALIKQREEVLALFSNASDREDYNAYHRSIESAVFDELQRSFKAYAALDNFKKMERIDELQQCFEAFSQLYEIQAAIPSKLDRVREAYTRVVFNPYTMTDMEERAKERVYAAFENYVLPYYFSDIQSSIACERLTAKLGNFESMYRTMISIREQDTRELEKELRRQSSAERIIQLLNIEWK